MNAQDLQAKMSIDQRATVAKVIMLTSVEFERCKNEQEVAILVNYLTNKIQQQAVSKMLSLNGGYVEVILDDDSSKKKKKNKKKDTPNADANTEPT